MTTRPRSGRPRRPGRPREEATEQAITAAARQVLADKGVARMSMEHVAAKAGVAKSTLYRRWPSKIELAVHAVAATFDEIEIDDHGSLAADMRAGIGEAARLLRDPSTGGAYAALLAESARDPDGVGRQVRESLSTRLHALVATSVERSIDRGEIRREMIDVDLLADVVVGSVMHRALATGEPDEAFVDGLIALLADVAYARLRRQQREADDEDADPT
ncbi:DNA-binding transcriptional regulator, AcrR family [Pedococcus dokdonensis]|uniref:DNA-binding transcriptional regulator, AcrR family n=1 Tax=Pedococcus dokdonensis TaxID=443156 RepID=A0A1H0R1Z9_9MICO|nr:TetR/AcrR family transcriptional regulator [Pedococcus dokdonensis]SDP23564.1 DNA-binding transcriptional regulator, AcrR family [Pedococcus dokdonensis]